MSLLSTFVSSHLIPALESALAEHEPALQAMLVTELQDLSKRLGAWIDEKAKEHIKE